MANTVKHAVVEISDLICTKAGHVFNMVDTKDLDNGCLVAKGDIDSKDYEIYKAKVPTTDDEVMLVMTVPVVKDARTQADKAECNFYNKTGEPMECGQLVKHDRFAVSEMLITPLSEKVVVGNFVIVGENNKYKEAASTTDEKFVAKIERVVTKGIGSAADRRVYLSVVKNG